MKKKWNKVTAALLMLVMVVTTVLGAAPALSVKAEPVTMGHLKSGSGNANGHFGSATPEAFVLSEKADYTNQAYSLKLRINSDVDKTKSSTSNVSPFKYFIIRSSSTEKSSTFSYSSFFKFIASA